MQFNSFPFIIFMLILMPVLAVTKNRKARHVELLIASYIFYGCWDYRFCVLMLMLTVVAYYSGRRIIGSGSKLFLRIGVIFPLIILAFFKYFNFFTDTFCNLFSIERTMVIKILLPVGISFYTFQAISYVVDVYRDKQNGHNSFCETALYIAFFPQLVAGPIVKAKDFFPQLKDDRNVSFKNLEAGLQLFALGLFKKLVVADRISVFVEEVYNNPHLFSGGTVILAIAAYSVQIYCDFSGYSDMAIGCAKCIGYDLKKNFDVPYISKNFQEFWRRWHISLSTWLREYLYISLGGNRKGTIRTYMNLFLTMLLGGLWHGANWNFVLWGMIHGALLCIHRFYKDMQKKAGKIKDTNSLLLDGINIILTFTTVSLVWVFFRTDSLSNAFSVFGAIFNRDGIVHNYIYAYAGIIFIIVEAYIKHIFREKTDCDDKHYEVRGILDLSTVWGMFVLLSFFGITLGLAYISTNPFIYFQF